MLKNNYMAFYASACVFLLAGAAYSQTAEQGAYSQPPASYSPAPANYTQSSEVFAGYNGWTDYDYGYIGGVTALNHDMKSDGWLVRGNVGYGQYSYSSMAVSGTNTVDMTNGNMMMGYQKFLAGPNGGRIAVYLGVDYEDDSLSKVDSTNPVRGDEFGLIGRAELRLNLDGKTFLNEEASYSSAFDSYISSTRYGFNFGQFAVGPEVEFLGNQAFDSQHFGLFVGDIRLADTLTASVSGGYEHSARQFSSGGYGNVSVGYGF